MFMMAICKASKITKPFLTVFKLIYTIFKQSCVPESPSIIYFGNARIMADIFQHLNQVIFDEIRRESGAGDRV